MKITHKKLTPRIHLLVFENQHTLTTTFLRFQEHYESPHFRGKTFSLDEYKKWYINNSSRGIKTGKFTYYSDWNGFNIPSYVLTPFYEGKFNPLSKQEHQFLNLFKNEDDAFYVIGVPGKLKNTDELLMHEIAHALFYTNENYKAKVLRVLSKYDIQPIRDEIAALGYHEQVLDDEVHAFCVDTGRDLETPIPERLITALQKLYKEYYK